MKITLLTWISLAIMAMTLNLGHAFMTPPSNHHALVVPQSVFRPTYEYSRDQGSPYSRDQVCVSLKTKDDVIKAAKKWNKGHDAKMKIIEAAKKIGNWLKSEVEKIFAKVVDPKGVIGTDETSN